MLPFGDRAVLITCRDRAERAAIHDRLAHLLPERSIREGGRSVLVVAAQPNAVLVDEVRTALSATPSTATSRLPPVDTITIDVVYDGADLAESAQVLGIDVAALVDAHTAQSWFVDVMGFAPGFAYLVPHGQPTADWARLPRRASPRPRVPAGSVAVAAGMSAVYPAAMPGGWNLLGRAWATLFDPNRTAAPSLLRPGMVVRFAAVAT